MVCHQCGFFHSFPAGTRVFHGYNLFLVTMRAAICFDISVDSFMYFQLAPGSFLDGYYFSSQWEPLHSFISVDSFMNFQLAPGLSWMQIIFGHNESSYVVCHQCGFFHAFSAGTRSFLNADHFWSQWEQLCGLSPVWFLSCVFSWYQGLCQAWLDLSIVIHGSVFKYTELDVSSTSNTLLLQWSPIHTFYWCEQRQHHLCVIRGPGHVHMYANQSDLKLFYAKTLKFD